jgi:hypothetical protein
MLASTAALAVLVVVLDKTELTAALADLVILAISEVMESRPEPVAVERTDDKLERALPTSSVMELSLDSAAELDERAEFTTLEMDSMGPLFPVAEPVVVGEPVAAGVTVVVVTWACLTELTWILYRHKRGSWRAAYRSQGNEAGEDGSITHADGGNGSERCLCS